MTYSTFLKSSFSEPTNNNFEGYLLYHGFEKVFTGLKGHININRQMGYRLTPLMMAVIFDRREAFCFLLANKKIVNLNAQDFNDYTALHHAAIKTDAIFYNLLLATGADRAIQDRYAGTAEDLYHHTHPGVKPIHPIVYEGREITLEEWERITHSKYTEGMVIEPKIAERIWVEFDEPSIVIDDQNFIEERYQEFCSNPPKVEFRNIGVTGNAAFLGEAVSKGAVVLEFVGEYNPFDRISNPYRLENIVSLTHRGVCSLIQDGAPNLVSVPLTAKGICQRALFVAVRDIKAGEPLYFNYGPHHSIKMAEYLELNGQRLREWIKGKNLKELQACFTIQSPSYTKASEIEDYTMIRYLSCTPPVLLALFLEQIIYKQEFLDLVSPELGSDISENFKRIVSGVLFQDTLRDRSYRNYVLKVLKEGNFVMASNLAANHKLQSELFGQNQEVSDTFMKKLENKIKVGMAAKKQ